jgi:hypothetical protein
MRSPRVSSTPEAGFSFLMGQAFTQLLFQSYPLPFWKASFVGKMFYLSLLARNARLFTCGIKVQRRSNKKKL